MFTFMLYCWCHILWKENKGSEDVGLLKPGLRWQCHVHVVRLCPIRPLPLGYNTRPLLVGPGLIGFARCQLMYWNRCGRQRPWTSRRERERVMRGPRGWPRAHHFSALTSSPFSNFSSPIISLSIPSSSPNLFCPGLTSHFLCSAFLSSFLISSFLSSNLS